ncbi:MAG TPA: hypothetical protein VNW68_08345 [Candidatus Limnocylindria bacterium]|nr:hypothetical protein [Candidatus Limnocylindria bacterium]
MALRAILITLALALLGSACGPMDSPVESATGIVVAVEGEGAANVSGFTLRTADGQTIDFVLDRLDLSRGGKPAPHLREHLVDGAPITVEYRVLRSLEGNLALRYTDAAETSQ